MVSKVHNFVGTVVTADGQVIPEKDWYATKQVFSYDKNRELIDEYARQSDPNFLAKERAKRRFERVQARQKELEELQARVRDELEKLQGDGNDTYKQ